ncbi:hypothetical protein B9Z55_007781 [Caenorhabditis nigoni]|nr:hypothetical protein B9Z55_007781 [Caenorhabditis nigoni]
MEPDKPSSELGKKKIRKFDESQKDVSDVIIVVRSFKFYVLKKYLASQSSFFKSLFIENRSVSNKREIALPGIDPDDFHYFLEVLYGESAIDDSNLEEVLFLADKLDSPIAKRKCEEFLLEKSKKTLEEKQQLAIISTMRYMQVKCLNNYLGFFVHCNPIAPSDKWSIQTKLEWTVVGANQNDAIITFDYCYEESEGCGSNNFLEWEKMEKEYLVDGNLPVEAKVTIIKTTGFEKQKIRKFDESQKEVSDVILVVKDTKFCVSKMCLASQSAFFKSLFVGNTTFFHNPAITLPGIDPDDFHYFLEVLYGESAIYDSTVEGVLFLADMMDSPTAKRRCEEFLLKESKKTFKTKSQITSRYLLDNWNSTCAISNANLKIKQFVLKHSFQKVTSLSMVVKRDYNHLDFYIYCEPIAPSDKWSIQTKLELKVVSRNQNHVIKTLDYCYEKSEGRGFLNFLEWEKMEKEYMVDGNLTVEAKVTIIETTGLGKKKIREFDESQKDVSDVNLVVRNTKFYASKSHLADRSIFFKALFFGKSSESKESEVILNGVDPNDFQYFLEVLYGESDIDDSTVEGILMVADKYETPMVVRKCTDFLLNSSKKSLNKKLDLAVNYNLEELKEERVSEYNTIAVGNLQKSNKSFFGKLFQR